MEQRVLWSLTMLVGVLGLVYRAFFRAIDPTEFSNKNVAYVSTDTTQSTSDTLESFFSDVPTTTKDPFRDSPSVQESKSIESRVKVVTENPNPVVIDGMRFHSTTDLFDGVETDTGSISTLQSSIPSMYIRNGSQKILQLLGLESTAKIIYKDVHNTHLVLLQGFDLNAWKQAVRKSGGSVLAIGSQIDRNNRGLFGDNAYQLTIPKYRNTKMIWLIQYRSDTRYTQIDQDWYKSGGKEFIKNALTSYYSKQ